MSARNWASPTRFIGWAFAALIALIGVSIVASLIILAFRGPGTSGSFPFFSFGFGWFFVFLLFLFFWGFGWWGGWGWYGRRSWYHAGDGAKSILRERYARGEIGKDQFDQMIRDLEQHA